MFDISHFYRFKQLQWYGKRKFLRIKHIVALEQPEKGLYIFPCVLSYCSREYGWILLKIQFATRAKDSRVSCCNDMPIVEEQPHIWL